MILNNDNNILFRLTSINLILIMLVFTSFASTTSMDKESTIGNCFLRPRTFLNQTSLLNHPSLFLHLHEPISEEKNLVILANSFIAESSDNDTKLNGMKRRSFQFQFISNVKMEIQPNSNNQQQEYIASKLMFGIGLLLIALFF